jgi:DNA-directed RNA polymerase specialized sigma24 family protein
MIGEMLMPHAATLTMPQSQVTELSRPSPRPIAHPLASMVSSLGVPIEYFKIEPSAPRVHRVGDAYLHAAEHSDLSHNDVERIAAELAVPMAEIVSMNRRLSGGDLSLNMQLGAEEDSDSLRYCLADDRENQEQEFAGRERDELRGSLVMDAMEGLDPRERKIFTERRLRDEPRSVESLSIECHISSSRMRQIEPRAMEKVERAIKDRARQLGSAANGVPCRLLSTSENIAREDTPQATRARTFAVTRRANLGS